MISCICDEYRKNTRTNETHLAYRPLLPIPLLILGFAYQRSDAYVGCDSSLVPQACDLSLLGSAREVLPLLLDD